jgi:hypothetical protein
MRGTSCQLVCADLSANLARNTKLAGGQSLGQSLSRTTSGNYERGFQEISITPLVLPSLEKGIYGAKVGNLDS